MNMNLKAINGMESDLEKTRKSTDAGQIFTTSNHKETKVKSAVAVDLNGILINNQAYKDAGKTKSDIMTEASNTDTAIRHNYMSIMANNMSAEDFAKAAKDGYDFSEMDPAETVTILDKIKATLAMSGTEVIGYTDDISEAQLAKITGSNGLANEIISSFHENDIPLTEENINETLKAIDNMENITVLSDGAVKYMTLNNLDATLENIYMSEHATNGQNRKGGTFIALEAGGYYAQKAEKLDWNSVEDQAKRIISDSGFDPEEEGILDQARWMIEEAIPLTSENIKKVSELKSLPLPMSEEDIVKLSAVSISNRSAKAPESNENYENNLKKAIDIHNTVQEISENAVEKVVEDQKPVNIQNLIAAQETVENKESKGIEQTITDNKKSTYPMQETPDIGNNSNIQSSELNNDKDRYQNNIDISQEREILIAKKQLEEIRLVMTVGANLRLIDKGINLETEPIKNVIDELTNEIAAISKEIFHEEDSTKYHLFEDTTKKVEEFYKLPIAVIGRHELTANESFETIYDDAKNLKLRYEKAGATYEAVGTEVRTDLGDNIKKAFRNVDELLKNTGQEINEENRRVVRILGYNRMEISSENIERVRAFDEKLMGVVNKLKPGAVLGMIKDGHNPLKMTLKELGDELSRQDKDPSKQEEKYSKFLYKLEKNAEITPEEKESYIGIYRLFYRLNSTDNAAIGAVLEMGAEMTIENLLSASRTAKAEKKGIDFKVDDAFGGLTGKGTETKSISEQIESAFIYYSEKADTVYENLDPVKLHRADANEKMYLDELAEKLLQDEAALEDMQAEFDYYSERAKEVRRVASLQTAENAVKELEEYNIEANTDLVEAYLNLKSGRKGRDNSVWSRAEKMASLAFKEVRQEMLDDLINEEEYESAYEEKLLNLSEELNEMLLTEADSYIDVKTIHLMQKQISVATRLAKQESYEIPVEIDGRVVSMHVTFRESNAEGSKVEAELETEFFGHISMAMTVDDGIVKGAFAASYRQSEDLSEYMNEVRDKFINGLVEKEPSLKVDSTNIGIFYRRQEAGSAVGGTENGIFDKRTLLRMAEIFVHAV